MGADVSGEPLLPAEENECDADADEQNAKPAPARNALAEKQLAPQSSGGVAQGSDGHDAADGFRGQRSGQRDKGPGD